MWIRMEPKPLSTYVERKKEIPDREISKSKQEQENDGAVLSFFILPLTFFVQILIFGKNESPQQPSEKYFYF